MAIILSDDQIEIWTVRSSSNWLLCLFHVLPLISKNVLTFQYKILDLLCTFPNPYQESVISPRCRISFYFGTVFRNQFLDARCVHCYLEAIANRNFQWTEPEKNKRYIIHIIYINIVINSYLTLQIFAKVFWYLFFLIVWIF